MPQTRVTASSGRMSRRDAYDALQTISAIAGTFPTDRTAANIAHDAQDYLRDIDQGNVPSKGEILVLQGSLNDLVTERLMRSERATPTTSRAITVYLYGTEANATARAFQVASQELQVPEASLALVDVSPVQTDRLTGSRWTIRIRTV